MAVEFVRFPDIENAEHEFIALTHFRADNHMQKVAFQIEGFDGFPNILPFSWHRETFERLLRERRGARGCIVEFGTAQGGSTRQLAKLAPSRTLYSLDAFGGVPASAVQFLDNRSPSTQQPGVIDFTDWPFKPEFWKRFYPNVVVIEGLFHNTIPVLAEQLDASNEPGVVLAYVDCNLYSSTAYALDFLTSRLVPGAAIVIDDYSGKEQCDGARKAADEWFASNVSTLKLRDASTIDGEGLFLVGE